MKKFVDLHLCLPIGKLETVDSMIRVARKLGYAIVGVSLPPNVTSAQIGLLREVCRNYGVDMATRVDLAPGSPMELLRLLRHVRRRFEIVSVVCSSKSVARQAAKDRRVDVLSFRAVDSRQRFFDRSEAELASKALAVFEIDMRLLLSSSGFLRMRILSMLRREVAIALSYDVPVIVSSGASDEFLLRSPRDFAALAMLFDMSMPYALKALSENPLGIVGRNREKLEPSFVAPGIRVVRRGKDC